MNSIKLNSTLKVLLLSLFFSVAMIMGSCPVAGYCEIVTSDTLMKGTRYETRYYVKRGKQLGPTVVLIGGVHGDEPAGYMAARKIKDWRVTKGTLVILPDAHREAIRRKMRGYPGNMNKMFPGKANGDDMERLAYSIWKMIKDAKPDLLLSLHESRGFHVDDPHRFGQTLTYDFHELDGYMQKALDRVNPAIGTKKHKFLLFVDPYPTCPTYNSWKLLKVPATGIETAKPLPLQTRIKYQMMMVQAFFDGVGLGYTQSDLPLLPTASNSPDMLLKSSAATSQPVVKKQNKPQQVNQVTTDLDTPKTEQPQVQVVAKKNDVKRVKKDDGGQVGQGKSLTRIGIILVVIGVGAGILWRKRV